MSGVAGSIGLTGCLRSLSGDGTPTPKRITPTRTSGSGIKDTDGDGVIDSEDYAPRDPEIQREEQVKGGSTPTEGQPSTETETATEEPTDTPNLRSGTILDDVSDGDISEYTEYYGNSFTVSDSLAYSGQYSIKANGGNNSFFADDGDNWTVERGMELSARVYLDS
jgi:hypothetical protein